MRSSACSTTRPASSSSSVRWKRPTGPCTTVAAVVYKNNSDGKGNSYGCHENYLMDRATPFARIVTVVSPHFITRQIYCGAGKVGARRRPMTVDRWTSRSPSGPSSSKNRWASRRR